MPTPSLSLKAKAPGDGGHQEGIERRAVIVLHICHLKNGGQLGRNYLKGIKEDKIKYCSSLSATTSAFCSSGD